MTKEPVYIRLSVDPAIRKRLKAIAVEQDTSIADLLRRSVEHYLAQQGIEINMSQGLSTWGGPGRKGGKEASDED